MNTAVEWSPGRRARLAGVLYLITIVAGVFAEVFVRGAVLVRDDAAATAARILAHEPLYRLGLAADLVMLAAYLGVTFLFYEMFKPVDAGLALLSAWFSLTGIAVLAAGSLTHAAPLLLLGPGHALDSIAPAQLQALALMSLRLHSRVYLIAGLFFGIYCILIGRLIFRSGFLPRILGMVMALGGIGYVTSTFVTFLSPALAGRLPDFSMIGGLAELALTLWLLIAGVAADKLLLREGAAV
jgi:hypothetical protein